MQVQWANRAKVLPPAGGTLDVVDEFSLDNNLRLNQISTLYVWVHPEYGPAHDSDWSRILFNGIAEHPDSAVVEVPYYHPRTREEVGRAQMREVSDEWWKSLEESFALSTIVRKLLGTRYLFWGDDSLSPRSRGGILGWSEVDAQILQDKFHLNWKANGSTTGTFLFDQIICFGYEQFNCVYGQYALAGLGLMANRLAMFGDYAKTPDRLERDRTLMFDGQWWTRTEKEYGMLLDEKRRREQLDAMWSALINRTSQATSEKA